MSRSCGTATSRSETRVGYWLVDAVDALTEHRPRRRALADDLLQIARASMQVAEGARLAGDRIGHRNPGQEAGERRRAPRGARVDVQEESAGLLRRVATVARVEREVVPRLGIDAGREPRR